MAITAVEAMAAIRKLNSALDDIICIDDDHKTLEQLVKSSEGLELDGSKHDFAYQAYHSGFISLKQSYRLSWMLIRPEKFREWLHR